MMIGSLRDLLGPLPRLDGAACTGRPELFDVLAHESPADTRRRVRLAQAVCSTCPVIAKCRASIREGDGEAVIVQGGVDLFTTDQVRNERLMRTARCSRERRAARAQVVSNTIERAGSGSAAVAALQAQDEAREMLDRWAGDSSSGR